MTSTTTGFLSFWQTYVLTYFAPILQMVLWVVEIFVLLKAVSLYKRYVEHKTRDKAAGKAEAVKPAAEVKVEEFVE